MANLINCKICGKEISSTASHCPKCGAVGKEPNTLEYHEKNKGYLLALIIGITALYLLVHWLESIFGKFPKLF